MHQVSNLYLFFFLKLIRTYFVSQTAERLYPYICGNTCDVVQAGNRGNILQLLN